MLAVICGSREEFECWQAANPAIHGLCVTSVERVKSLRAYTFDGVVECGSYYELAALEEIRSSLAPMVRRTACHDPSKFGGVLEAIHSYLEFPVVVDPFVKPGEIFMSNKVSSAHLSGISTWDWPGDPDLHIEYKPSENDRARSHAERKLLAAARELTEEQIEQVTRMAEVIGKLHPRKKPDGFTLSDRFIETVSSLVANFKFGFTGYMDAIKPDPTLDNPGPQKS